MRKILLASGGGEINTPTLDFACYLARLTHSRLTGLFLEKKQHPDSLEGLVVPQEEESVSAPASGPVQDPASTQTTRPSIVRFRDACINREVEASVRHHRDVSWPELLTECRYADVLIVEAEFSLYPGKGEGVPTHHVKALLHEAECPVIVAPSGFERIDKIILTCDGSKSSVFAIRQFMHLFPEFRDTPVTVLEIRPEGQEDYEARYLLQEWLHPVFQQLEYVLLEGESDNRLPEYLMSHPHSLIVMGGYSRSRLSRILQPSAASAVVRLVSAPVFIAHP